MSSLAVSPYQLISPGQVLSWQSGRDEFCVATVPLNLGGQAGTQPMDDPGTQKMIVCHDMMGGYGKDKYTQGAR